MGTSTENPEKVNTVKLNVLMLGFGVCDWARVNVHKYLILVCDSMDSQGIQAPYDFQWAD